MQPGLFKSSKEDGEAGTRDHSIGTTGLSETDVSPVVLMKLVGMILNDGEHTI